MTRTGENNALQVIFSFFLGLMVLAFIVVGVITFYPSPQSKYEDQLQDLYREQERYNMKQPDKITPGEQAELAKTQDKIDAINKKQQAEQEVWARNTSIVLILFATGVMAISLVRSEQLRVLSNGLLMGGLFTMVAGVVWVLFAGESTARFLVISFAFVVTLALGYVKFSRVRDEQAPQPSAALASAGGAVAPLGEEWGSVIVRLDRLEARTAAAAAALGAEKTAAPPASAGPPAAGEAARDRSEPSGPTGPIA